MPPNICIILVVFLWEGDDFVEEQEQLQILAERFESYLTGSDKKYDSSQMINSIISTIVQYFDCDYNKLIEALESLAHMKNIDEYTKYSDVLNVFDVSNTTSQISVKGFLSKGSPIIFFYVGDNENPSGVIKTRFDDGSDFYSVEISNNPDALALFKKDDFKLANSYVFVDEFEYADDKCVATRNIYAETDASQKDMFKILDVADVADEHKNFMVLLNNAMNDKGIDLTKISGFGADILFLSFYDEVKNMCKNENLLPLGDLVYLINETIYPEKENFQIKESALISKINLSAANENENQQKKGTFDVVIDGKQCTYVIVKSEKYFSAEVYEGDKKVCGAMIISSADGFSFFRSNGDFAEDGISSFVINVSENKVKLMTIEGNQDKKKPCRKIETLVSFESDGAIKMTSFDSRESKVKKKKNIQTKVGLGE